MVQKDKARIAFTLALKMKSIADSLEREARSYDCKWPMSIADRLRNEAEDALKKLK